MVAATKDAKWHSLTEEGKDRREPTTLHTDEEAEEKKTKRKRSEHRREIHEKEKLCIYCAEQTNEILRLAAGWSEWHQRRVETGGDTWAEMDVSLHSHLIRFISHPPGHTEAWSPAIIDSNRRQIYIQTNESNLGNVQYVLKDVNVTWLKDVNVAQKT